MTFLTWVSVGVVTGFLGALILSRSKPRQFGRFIFVGTLGAFAGGIFLAPRFDIQITIQPSFTYPILMIGIAGAITGLAIYHVVRIMRARTA